MSHIWIIVVQWAVVVHVPTGKTYTIYKIQWVCLSKFHEWWEFEVPRYREELKAQYGEVLSFDFYFLSLFEYFANSQLSLVPLCLRQKWAPTPEEVLREADADDGYEAPGWVTSAVYEFSGLQWLLSATYLALYVLTMWASVRFNVALWGGGVRGSMAQYLLVAMTWANQRRPVSGGKTNFMATNLLALIPWQAVVGLHRLSEKVEDDAVVPSEPVLTYPRWSLALYGFYFFISVLLFYFNRARFDVSMGGAVVVFVALAVAAAVLLLNDDDYKLETALALQQPDPETECLRVELKSIREGTYAQVNDDGEKEREDETDLLAAVPVARHQLDARPARFVLIALLAVLGAVVGAALFGYTRSGTLAGFVLGCGVGGIRFGPKQGIPMVYVVDTRILQWLVDSGIWCLVCSKGRREEIRKVEFRDAEPSPVDDESEWAKFEGQAIVVQGDDGFKLFKGQPPSRTHKKEWCGLQPSYELKCVTEVQLERVMALRLFRNGVDQGALVPAGTIIKAPIDRFPSVAREVIKASNEVATWPIGGPVRIDLREHHELVTLGEAQMKVRSDTRRTRHQVAIARVLELLADGALDYSRAFLGVALSFACVAVAAWSCGLVAAGATACACVLALSCVVTGITGASVDMLSEVKHSVTVEYWRGPQGAFFRLLRAALVLAILCGVCRGADLFWWVLCGGLFSLVIGLSLGLFGAPLSMPIAVAGCGSSRRFFKLSIESGSGRKDLCEVVVGAFAAAVFVFFRVFECGDVVKVMLDDESWVLGRIEKIYDGDEKQETLYDIAALDEGYDRRDFFVDPGEFEFPDPPLPFAVGVAVVHLETGRKGRILQDRAFQSSYWPVQFPYVDEPLSLHSRSMRVIPEAQAAPSVAHDVTLLLSGVTATLADASPRICSTDGKPDFVCSVLDTLDARLNQALCCEFKATPVVEAAFKGVDELDCWHCQSELLGELQEKVSGSFCTADRLLDMVTEKLEPHFDLLEKLRRQSSCELAEAKAPPPGSRVVVRSSDGVDHDGTVGVALNETCATVQFDDGTANLTVDFPDADVRVTHVEPAPSTGSSTGSFVVADDAVEPVPAVRRSRATVNYAESDEEDDETPPLEPVPQGRGEKRKTPTSNEPASIKRWRQCGNVDEDYDPTAGNVEDDEDDEQDEQKYDSDGDVQM